MSEVVPGGTNVNFRFTWGANSSVTTFLTMLCAYAVPPRKAMRSREFWGQRLFITKAADKRSRCALDILELSSDSSMRAAGVVGFAVTKVFLQKCF